MANIIIVIGTPGAGKSTVIDALKEKGVKVVNMGDEILSRAAKEYRVRNRDKLRYLPQEAQFKLRKEVFRKLDSMKGDIILDTHASIKAENRYVPAFFVEELRQLKGLKAFVVIDAPEKEILARRRKDKSRTRQYETADAIHEQETINLAILASFATHLNISIYVIQNRQGRLKEAVNELHGVAKTVFG